MPLRAVRDVLTDADEVLLGVAFVHRAGVNLLERALRGVARGRLISTTVFGSTTVEGLSGAEGHGLAVRVLNPSGRSTFHPKIYLGRHRDRLAAVVGSANLTAGLITNIEAVSVLDGPATAPPLRDLWALAKSWWEHPDAVGWQAGVAPASAEVLSPELLERIRAAVAGSPVVVTVTDGRPNRVTEISPEGVWVATQRSRRLERPPQLVEAWMLQVAWEYLSTHGSLTNRFLLADDGLNVKRSSFVCALLAAFPDVVVTRRRPIELRLAAPARLAAESRPSFERDASD